MSILKELVNSSSIFVPFFTVMTHNSSVHFKLIHFFYFGQKDPIKVPILTLSSTLVKICQIPHVIFQSTCQFFFKFCITHQCHERWLLSTVLAQTFTFVTRNPLKCKFFRLSSAQVRFVKFLMSVLKRQVNSSSIFASFFIVMTYNCSVHFKLINFPTLDKRIPSKSQFWYFQVLWWKFAKFLISFIKPQVSFSSNFASLFSVMKDNFSVPF